MGTRPSNQGAYRCVASNAYGVAQSVVNLSVHGEQRRPAGSASLFLALILSTQPPSLNPASADASPLGILPLGLSFHIGAAQCPPGGH